MSLCVLQLHKLGAIPSVQQRHENRYLNTQAEPKAEAKDLFDLATPTSTYKRRGSKRKNKQGGKKRKNGKRKKRKGKKKRKSQVPVPTSPASQMTSSTQPSQGGKMTSGGMSRSSSAGKYQV